MDHRHAPGGTTRMTKLETCPLPEPGEGTTATMRVTCLRLDKGEDMTATTRIYRRQERVTGTTVMMEICLRQERVHDTTATTTSHRQGVPLTTGVLVQVHRLTNHRLEGLEKRRVAIGRMLISTIRLKKIHPAAER